MSSRAQSAGDRPGTTGAASATGSGAAWGAAVASSAAGAMTSAVSVVVGAGVSAIGWGEEDMGKISLKDSQGGELCPSLGLNTQPHPH